MGCSRGRLAGLDVRLYGLVLCVEVGHIHHQVLHDKHVRQRRDLGSDLGVALDFGQTRQAVRPVDVHSARAANALSIAPGQLSRLNNVRGKASIHEPPRSHCAEERLWLQQQETQPKST